MEKQETIFEKTYTKKFIDSLYLRPSKKLKNASYNRLFRKGFVRTLTRWLKLENSKEYRRGFHSFFNKINAHVSNMNSELLIKFRKHSSFFRCYNLVLIFGNKILNPKFVEKFSSFFSADTNENSSRDLEKFKKFASSFSSYLKESNGETSYSTSWRIQPSNTFERTKFRTVGRIKQDHYSNYYQKKSQRSRRKKQKALRMRKKKKKKKGGPKRNTFETQYTRDFALSKEDVFIPPPDLTKKRERKSRPYHINSKVKFAGLTTSKMMHPHFMKIRKAQNVRRDFTTPAFGRPIARGTKTLLMNRMRSSEGNLKKKNRSKLLSIKKRNSSNFGDLLGKSMYSRQFSNDNKTIEITKSLNKGFRINSSLRVFGAKAPYAQMVSGNKFSMYMKSTMSDNYRKRPHTSFNPRENQSRVKDILNGRTAL